MNLGQTRKKESTNFKKYCKEHHHWQGTEKKMLNMQKPLLEQACTHHIVGLLPQYLQ